VSQIEATFVREGGSHDDEVMKMGGTFEEAADISGDSETIVRTHYAKWSATGSDFRPFGTYLAREKTGRGSDKE
jgi:hypothetical protein